MGDFFYIMGTLNIKYFSVSWLLFISIIYIGIKQFYRLVPFHPLPHKTFQEKVLNIILKCWFLFISCVLTGWNNIVHWRDIEWEPFQTSVLLFQFRNNLSEQYLAQTHAMLTRSNCYLLISTKFYRILIIKYNITTIHYPRSLSC